jgi:hypothetical protein
LKNAETDRTGLRAGFSIKAISIKTLISVRIALSGFRPRRRCPVVLPDFQDGMTLAPGLRVDNLPETLPRQE